MSNNTNKIFSKSECISSDILKEYILKKLSDNEKRRVEEHLIDCQMCRDELEGLENFKSIESAEKTVENINSKIQFRYGGLISKPNTISVITGIAAAISIAIISGYIIMLMMNNFEKKQLAQELGLQKESERKKQILLQDSTFDKKTISVGAREKSGIITDKNKQKEKKPVVSIEKTIVVHDIADAEEDVSEMEKEVIPEEKEKLADDEIKTVEKKEEIAILGVTSEMREPGQEPAGVLVDQLKTKTMHKQTKKADSKTVAYQIYAITATSVKYDGIPAAYFSFEQGDYENAKNILEVEIKNENQNDSLFYYYAVSCYHLNIIDSTINYLNKIQNQNLFVDERKWYLANSYLKKGFNDKTIPLLEELTKTKNTFTEKAKLKLSEISTDE